MSADRKRKLAPEPALDASDPLRESPASEELPSIAGRRKLGLAAFLLAVLLAFLAYFTPISPVQGKARLGWLDAASLGKEPLPLAGEWEIVEDSRDSAGSSGPRYATLPMSWEQPYGRALYRLRVRGLDPGQSYALRTSCLDTSYRLWANDTLLLTGGKPGTEAENTKPAYYSGLAVLPQGHSELELRLEVANFVHFRGGPTLPILFGPEAEIKRYDNWSVASDTVIIAVLVLSAILAAMSAGLRKSLSSLYYSLLCLSGTSFFFLLSPEFLVFRLFPSLDWELYVKLAFISAPTSALWFMLTARSLFGGLSGRSTLILSAPTLLFSLAVLFLPPEVFTRATGLIMLNCLVLAAFAIVLFARAVVKAYPYAKILSFGFAILLANAGSLLVYSGGRLLYGGFFILSFLYPLGERLGFSRFSLDLGSYALSLIGQAAFSLIFFIEAPKLGKPSPALARDEGREAVAARCEELGLSPRELEVTLLALEGKRNKEIAEALFVSENTIKTHLARIFAKLGIKARSELFAYFARR